jgi:molybdate transport system substrate-binding protein
VRNISFALASFAVLLLAGCGSNPANPPAKTTLTVFAAASLTESFTELGKRFEAAHPGTSIVFNFGGSQQLLSQLQNGAAGDVFAPASPKEIDAAKKEDLVGASEIFGCNRLVLVSPSAHELNDLKELAKPGVKVVIADVAVPAGRYAQQLLKALRDDKHFGATVIDAIEANVVSREENVKAVLAKVRLGEADAGLVYQTDAKNTQGVHVAALPVAANPLAKYPIAALTKAPQSKLAGEFVQFVLSPDGQKTLAEFGFLGVNENK